MTRGNIVSIIIIIIIIIITIVIIIVHTDFLHILSVYSKWCQLMTIVN